MFRASASTVGGKSGAKSTAQDTETVVDSKKQGPSHKNPTRKGAAAGKKSSAEVDAEAARHPAATANQSNLKQSNIPPGVIDLLTPNDLIKKSSANRLKQKQSDQAQQSAEEPALVHAAKTAPGKKVATRGRNANLQVLEVEPQTKRGKRKAASETTNQLNQEKAAAAAAAEEPDQDAFLPNRKRPKPSKSAHAAAAAAAAASGGQGTVAAQQHVSKEQTTLKEVPGLPGVKHHMPSLLGANARETKPTQPATAAAPSESHSQSRSNNSKRQAGAGRAAKAAEVSQPEASSKQQSQAAAAPAVTAVDRPADRSVALAMQPTLASAGASQGMQFQRLQVRIAGHNQEASL